MNEAQSEGAVSHYAQCTTFGLTYLARNLGLGISVVLLAAMSLLPAMPLAWLLTSTLVCLLALVSRALFYVLVVPTTMPGAFFWKNKAFEEHARDIGLDHNPASGVAPLAH